MKIQYLGHASFLLKNRAGSVVTDPFDPTMVGIKFPKVEADIVTISHQHQDHNRSDLVGGQPVVFDFPGDYERKRVRVFGYQSYHDGQKGSIRGENIIFKIIIDNIVVLHCGDLGHLLDEETLEKVKDTNVLLVPVGGFYTISAKEAVELAEMIGPEIIVPMHFNHPKLNQQTFGKLSGVEEFLKLMGKETLQPVKRLEITSETLPEKEVVLLEF